MSTWRKKAMECLPDCKKEFESPDTDIYLVFSELLHSTVAAHKNNDRIQLKKNYDFAAWCFSQKTTKDLWNAAAVAFYEHLGDHPATREAMPQWITRQTYDHIRGLLEWRLNEVTLKEIDAGFGIKKQ
jgi:hypothetical protein